MVLKPNHSRIFLEDIFLEDIFLVLEPLEFFVRLKACFLDLHQVKVTCYHRYLLLYSN